MTLRFVDELESLLRANASAPSPSSSSQTSSQGTSSTPVSTTNDFGILPAAMDKDTDSPSSAMNALDLGEWSASYFGESVNEHQGGANLPNFTGAEPLGQLSAIETLLGTPAFAVQQEHASISPPSSAHGNSSHISASPPVEIDSAMSPDQAIVTATHPSDSLVSLSWPANLPDMVTTRHL